jgi:hypothetical protein
MQLFATNVMLYLAICVVDLVDVHHISKSVINVKIQFAQNAQTNALTAEKHLTPIVLRTTKKCAFLQSQQQRTSNFLRPPYSNYQS